jgi:hypothetical protein
MTPAVQLATYSSSVNPSATASLSILACNYSLVVQMIVYVRVDGSFNRDRRKVVNLWSGISSMNSLSRSLKTPIFANSCGVLE